MLTSRRTNESEKVECNLENELNDTCFKLFIKLHPVGFLFTPSPIHSLDNIKENEGFLWF